MHLRVNISVSVYTDIFPVSNNVLWQYTNTNKMNEKVVGLFFPAEVDRIVNQK